MNKVLCGVIASLCFALVLALAANEPRTCEQEFKAGYNVGVSETTAAFRETLK